MAHGLGTMADEVEGTVSEPDLERDLALRSVESSDRELLSRIYASTREEEIAVTGWSDDQKAAFLAQQFEAQHTFYQEQFPEAEFSVILYQGQPAGRLYVDRRSDEIRLIDIALLPEYRNRGIGSGYLKRLLAEAQRVGLPVRIHVEQNNRALRLYRRLGFLDIGTNGVYFLMEWRPRGGRNAED